MHPNRLIVAALVLCFLAPRAALATSPSPGAASQRVRIVTQYGDVVVQLDPKHAPKTVANFLNYVDAKFYDGGTFFRAVPGFVIQGGNRSRENPSYPKLELESPSLTGDLNKDGAISMARTSDPNSATSEFFICDGDQPRLDQPPGYAAFGYVVSGMDVVRKIARLPADNQQLVEPVRILKIVRAR